MNEDSLLVHQNTRYASRALYIIHNNDFVDQLAFDVMDLSMKI